MPAWHVFKEAPPLPLWWRRQSSAPITSIVIMAAKIIRYLLALTIYTQHVTHTHT